ncbi:hypothetical protein ACJJTC_002809 [Scirpophaga incertulas]
MALGEEVLISSGEIKWHFPWRMPASVLVQRLICIRYVWAFLFCCDRICKRWSSLDPRGCFPELARAWLCPWVFMTLCTLLMGMPQKDSSPIGWRSAPTLASSSATSLPPMPLCSGTLANVTELVEPSILRSWAQSRVSWKYITSDVKAFNAS